jgi:hypothetical protein
MGRPQIFLKDWCLEDSLLKAEFLKKERKIRRSCQKNKSRLLTKFEYLSSFSVRQLHRNIE